MWQLNDTIVDVYHLEMLFRIATVKIINTLKQAKTVANIMIIYSHFIGNPWSLFFYLVHNKEYQCEYNLSQLTANYPLPAIPVYSKPISISLPYITNVYSIQNVKM